MTSKTYVDGVTLFDADSANAFNDAIYEGVGLGGFATVNSATTPDIFATTVSGRINYTGTTPCTGFTAAPAAGAVRVLICTGAAVFTAGANMLIDGVSSGDNLTCAANDLVTVFASSTTQFRLVHSPYAAAASITLGTPTASTSGTSINFTSIPTGKKRITVMFSGVSTNAAGASPLIIQIGDSGGIETTGYLGGGATVNRTTGFYVTNGVSSAFLLHGSAILSLENSSANTWTCQTGIYRSDGVEALGGGGAKSLSATLDRVRITTVNGTDAFDAGEINISYE